MNRRTALEVICSLFILLFLYTGISKFLNFPMFVSDMHNQPFPRWLAGLVICTVPSAECILALLLCFEKTRLFALWGSFFLMILFTLYTAIVLLHFFSRIPCGCGGIIRKLTWPQHFVLNIFMTTISIVGIRLQKKILMNK